MIFKSAIVSKEEFQQFKFGFSSIEDPTIGQPIQRQFNANEFRQVKAGSASIALFQMAALNRINEEFLIEMKIALSLKYQVLCDETALVGVIKELDNATGQIKQYEMTAAKGYRPGEEPVEISEED